MITIINKLSDFAAARASHKTLIAVGGDDDRYRLTAEKCPAGIQFEITDEEAPSTASTDIVYYGGRYSDALKKLRVLDDEDCGYDFDPENIYNTPSIAQAIAEDRQ